MRKIIIFILAIFLTSFSYAEFVKPKVIDTSIQKKESEELFNKSMSIFKSGNYSKAESSFKEYVSKYPETEKVPEAKYYIALCNIKLFKFRQAQTIVSELLKKYKTGELSDKLKKLDSEIKKVVEDMDFMLGIDKVSNNQESEIELIKSGDFDKAIISLLKKLNIRKDYMSYFYLGMAYQKKAEIKYPKQPVVDYNKLAIQAYENAIKINGGLEAIYNLAKLYELTGEIKKSQSLYKKIINKYPESDIAATIRKKLESLHYEGNL